jgi:hypothetical protein
VSLPSARRSSVIVVASHPPGALDEIVFQPHAGWRLELANSDFDEGLAFIETKLARSTDLESRTASRVQPGKHELSRAALMESRGARDLSRYFFSRPLRGP